MEAFADWISRIIQLANCRILGLKIFHYSAGICITITKIFAMIVSNRWKYRQTQVDCVVRHGKYMFKLLSLLVLFMPHYSLLQRSNIFWISSFEFSSYISRLSKTSNGKDHVFGGRTHLFLLLALCYPLWLTKKWELQIAKLNLLYCVVRYLEGRRRVSYVSCFW